MSMPWFKCAPEGLLEDFVGLSDTECRVYMTILCRIYIEGGPVRDDPDYWAPKLGLTIREWRACRKNIVKRGRLRALDIELVPHLTNLDAEGQLAGYASIVAKRRRAAGASLNARGLKARKHLKLVED
jgi:hypothetical protein